MKKTFITILVTLIGLSIGFYLYVLSGSYDISQLTPHNSLTKSLISTTKHKSIDKRLEGIALPDNLDDTTLLISGFKIYDAMCVMCHSAPGEVPNEMAAGLYPKPPELYKKAKEREALEFFWIIENGIKMTSMPAYQPTYTKEQIWAITAFVTHKLAKMTPEEYSTWKSKYTKTNSPAQVSVSKNG
jgi:mono/diheme cytochrome c family protein